MKLKRLLVSCVAVAMTVSLVPAVVFASTNDESENTAVIEVADAKEADVVAKLDSPSALSGSCGKNVRYDIDPSTGVMTISGSGTMSNFKANKAPWNDHKDKITAIKFTGKVTSIGNYAFKGLTKVTTVYIHGYIKTIGEGAFYGCTGLKKVTGGKALTQIKAYAFKGCSSLTSFSLTATKLSKIGAYAFKGSALKTLKITKTAKLTKKGVKKSLKGSKIKTVDVKNSKKLTYTYYFLKGNSGKGVKVT